MGKHGDAQNATVARINPDPQIENPCEATVKGITVRLRVISKAALVG
jgi:hypothetical protein